MYDIYFISTGPNGGQMTRPWASATIKIMVFPQFRWLKSLGIINGGYINTHCFNGGWNPRADLVIFCFNPTEV